MQNITYSEIIYLFADKILSDRSKFINYDSHPSGEKLPVHKLSHEMVLGATVYLIQKGFIKLYIKNVKKLFLFPGKDIFVKRTEKNREVITGIEGRLLENIQDETKLSKAVYYLLSEDESSPWGQIINISKRSLVDKKILSIETKSGIFSVKRYVYDPQILSQYTPYFNEMKQNVLQFSKDIELYKFVFSAVKSGIASRKEQSTSDD